MVGGCHSKHDSLVMRRGGYGWGMVGRGTAFNSLCSSTLNLLGSDG